MFYDKETTISSINNEKVSNRNKHTNVKYLVMKEICDEH